MMGLDTPLGWVEIRELRTIEEMIAAEKIQLLVWGAEIIPHPKEMLIPVQHEGGLLAGAFSPAGDLVGLVFHFPTSDPAVVHSQMLAVLGEWRGKGIGRQMKWFQRSWCLERGISRVRWTVDPLRAANAEINIRRLGATCSTYLTDYYGPMQGIDAGMPSDRLLVEWDLASVRVCRLAKAVPADSGFPEAGPALQVNERGPASLHLRFDGSPVLIQLPEDFINLAKEDPALALAWRLETRTLFLQAFAAGYAISGFTRQGGPAYLLEKGLE
jgi:chorismate synthase